jgi:integrase
MAKKLTARTVKSIKPVAGKRLEVFDAAVTGLALRVTEQGAKSWCVFYRHRGRLRRFTIGTIDALTLAQARERARGVLHNASKGADPATEKQDGKKAETIGELADLYIEKWAKPRKRSWKADRNLLDHKVLPKWRPRAIVDISRQDVRQLVESIADAGAPIVANRVAALLSKLFAFALDRDLVTVSPAVRIPRPGQEQRRDRVLSETELRALWEAWDDLPAPMAAFYRLRLLTAQRGGEVASMRWQDLDLEAGWWTVPATSSKNKLAHRVPLNVSAVTILAMLLQTADKDAVYVLEAHYRGKGMGARGKRQQAEAAKAFPVENFRGHDLRRTAATLMASGGVARLVVGKILNHAETSVTAVYDRATYDAEKTAALTWWDAKLSAILEQKAGTILAFTKGA